MLPPDNHVHSEWSWDTHSASMRDTCARAVEIGLPAVAFTEHVDFRRWGPEDGRDGLEVDRGYRTGVSTFDVEGYLASVEECRDRFPDLRVVAGIEAGEPHLFAGSLAGCSPPAPSSGCSARCTPSSTTVCWSARTRCGTPTRST